MYVTATLKFCQLLISKKKKILSSTCSFYDLLTLSICVGIRVCKKLSISFVNFNKIKTQLVFKIEFFVLTKHVQC